MALDPDISPDTMLTLAGTVTHHQKTVLVDYELPESAVGFVMGHNMLDEYWDTDKHSALFRPGNNMDPRLGANGKLPRQDISSRVTGRFWSICIIILPWRGRRKPVRIC